jgi:hypothetical protein
VGPAGDVGRQGVGERRVRSLESQKPGGEVAELGPGEPGADRAEVIQPGGGTRSADQDRSSEVGAGPGAGEPAADQDVGGGQMADFQPVAAALAGLVGEESRLRTTPSSPRSRLASTNTRVWPGNAGGTLTCSAARPRSSSRAVRWA